MTMITKAEALKRLESLCNEASRLSENVNISEPELIKWKRDARVTIQAIFGTSSGHLEEFNETIRPKNSYDRNWEIVDRGLAILRSMMDETKYLSNNEENSASIIKILPVETNFPIKKESAKTPIVTEMSSKPIIAHKKERVFIVHGHDEEMKQAVARCLEKLKLKPIILHEQPNSGKTVIEKLNEYSDVQFAVVLLSPDDIGYPKENPKQPHPRARQNVILELGFFIGKLGRECVIPLYRETKEFELPSDFTGVIYQKYDESGVWRFELVKELNSQGFGVDANELINKP